jgi:hypothetical protein
MRPARRRRSRTRIRACRTRRPRRRAGKPLRAQDRQRLLDPSPASLAEPAPRRAVRQQPGHGTKIEHAAMRGAEGSLQRRLRQGGRGARVVGTQDVAETDHQAVDALARDPRLFLLDGRPGVTQEPGRQGGIAAGHLAVRRELRPDLACIFQESRVAGRRHGLHGALPQLGQRATLAGRDPPADFPLDPERTPAQGLAGHAGRRDGAQRGIDGCGQRPHVLVTGPGEDHRKIVAQRFEVAVGSHERRAQAADFDRPGLAVGVAAGEMKDDLGLELLVHDRHGQTVNLSSSASNEARIVSVVRSMPARRRSS